MLRGILWLVEALDYEKRKEHRLRVAVTDGTQKAEAEMAIVVENANDNSPVFRHASYAFSVNGTADEILGSIGTVTVSPCLFGVGDEAYGSPFRPEMTTKMIELRTVY